MKKLQRFGIVSLAALTLGALTLGQEVIVKAEENPPVEAPTADSQPVADESLANEESNTPVEEVDANRDSEAVAEADTSAENLEASGSESTATAYKYLSVNTEFDLGEQYTEWGEGRGIYLSKGESLSVADLLEEGGIWEVAKIEFLLESGREGAKWETLTPTSKISYDDLLSDVDSRLTITYKAKNLAPNSPKTSTLVDKDIGYRLYLVHRHYLVTEEGLTLIAADSVRLDKNDTSYTPAYKDYVNLEPLGASVLKSYSRIEPFTVGDSIQINDDSFKDSDSLNFFYKKKDDAHVMDYFNKSVLGAQERRNFRVFYVDENGRQFTEASIANWSSQSHNLIPGIKMKIARPDIKGYKPREAETVVSYDDLSESYGNIVRVVYDLVDKEAVEPLKLRVLHLTGEKNEEETVFIRPDQSVTLKAKRFDGYYTFQDSVTLNYDQISKLNPSYTFYYQRDGEQPSGPSNTITVHHILDDGKTSISERIFNSESEHDEKLTLTVDGPPIAPKFKTIEGWEPDRSKSYQMAIFIQGGGIGAIEMPFEEGLVYHYGQSIASNRIVLVYKKADADTTTPDTKPEDTPSQPVDTDTEPNTGATDTDTNTDGKTDVVDNGTTNPDKPSTGTTETPATGEEDKGTDTPSQPVDTDTKPNTGTTETDTTTAGKTDVVDNGTTNPDKPSTGTTETPATGEVDKETETPSQPVDTDTKPDTGLTDTPNTSTPDTDKDAEDKPTVTPETPSTGEAGKDTDTKQPVDTTDKVTDSTSQEPPVLVGDKVDLGKNHVEVEEKPARAEKTSVTPATSDKPVAKPQALSRVESRHLPETGDSKNSFALLVLAILGLLGFYNPKRSGHKKV